MDWKRCDDEACESSLLYQCPDDGQPFSRDGMRNLQQQLFDASKRCDSALLDMAALAIRRLLDEREPVDMSGSTPAKPNIFPELKTTRIIDYSNGGVRLPKGWKVRDANGEEVRLREVRDAARGPRIVRVHSEGRRQGTTNRQGRAAIRNRAASESTTSTGGSSAAKQGGAKAQSFASAWGGWRSE